MTSEKAIIVLQIKILFPTPVSNLIFQLYVRCAVQAPEGGITHHFAFAPAKYLQLTVINFQSNYPGIGSERTNGFILHSKKCCVSAFTKQRFVKRAAEESRRPACPLQKILLRLLSVLTLPHFSGTFSQPNSKLSKRLIYS